MKAFDMSFYFMASPSYYDIPFFQRAYVWGEENWKELYEDLSSKKINHFLGSVILKNEMVPAGSNSRYFVIDGQQRLTTLSILVRACYDHMAKNVIEFGFDEETLSQAKFQMRQILFVSEGDMKIDYIPKINHSKLDKEAYENVIKGGLDNNDQWEKESYGEDSNDSQIVKAYVYFRNMLDDSPEEQVIYLWKTLTANKDKFLVNINLDADDDEQAIFDTVNSAGVILSSADTIKNTVFQKYVEVLNISGVSNVNEYAIKKYSDTWEKTFIASKENDDYWSTMRQYGRMKKSNLEVFLHAYAVIKSFFDPSADYMTELPRKYKDYISGKSLDELDKFLEEMCDYAIIFKDCFSENDNLSYSDYVGRIFNICNALELSTFYPYLLQQLYLLKKKLADEEVIKNRLFGLEKYIILNAICNGTTKNYNKECIQLVNGSIDSQSLINGSIDINDGRFMNGLRNMTSNKLPTLLLFWVELYLRQSDYFGVRNLNYEFTLEHIMPQKWKENWLDVPAYNINGDLCETIEEKEYTRRKSIYEIGNMTLLKSKLNSSVSNGTFEDKKNGKNGKPGIIYYGDLLITNEVTKEDEWNDKKIYQRTQLMEDRIREIWDAQNLPEESEAKMNPEGGRYKVRYEFWEYALPIIRNINDNQIYTNHIAKTSNCVAGSIGIGGFSVNITANFDKARVDFSLYKKDANENKKAFDILYSKKAEIEEKIGRSLIWSRCDELRGSWVSYEMSNVSIANKEDWDKMVKFLGEGSKKFREIFIPYLEKDYPVEASNIDPDIQLKRIASYEIIKDWIQQTDKIVPCLEKSNRRYIRFTTKKMSEYLPNIAGSRSGWNSENHYFYEIINKNGSNIYVKFVISGFDLNEELKAKVTKINDVAEEKLNREEWKWWTVYSTDKFKLPDDLNKDKVFEVLDNLIENILDKEKRMLDLL